MKADPNGRPAEQTRARIDWKPRAQIKTQGGDVSRRCGRCRFVGFVLFHRRGDHSEWLYQCRQPAVLGLEPLLTRKTATCKHWELKP